MAARRPGLERSKTGSASHRVSQVNKYLVTYKTKSKQATINFIANLYWHFSFQDTPVVQVAQASRPREAAGPKISPVINPLLSTASCAAYTPS